MNRRKLGARLAFLVHHGHLSVVGLELLADAFTTIELQELGGYIHDARLMLEQRHDASAIRANIAKFLRRGHV